MKYIKCDHETKNGPCSSPAKWIVWLLDDLSDLKLVCSRHLATTLTEAKELRVPGNIIRVRVR